MFCVQILPSSTLLSRVGKLQSRTCLVFSYSAFSILHRSHKTSLGSLLRLVALPDANPICFSSKVPYSMFLHVELPLDVVFIGDINIITEISLADKDTNMHTHAELSYSSCLPNFTHHIGQPQAIIEDKITCNKIKLKISNIILTISISLVLLMETELLNMCVTHFY